MKPFPLLFAVAALLYLILRWRKLEPESKVLVALLAAGLGVTPLTVATAALESWGIRTRPNEVTDTLATLAIDPSLSDRDRRQLRNFIRDLREHSALTTGATDDLETQAQSSASPMMAVRRAAYAKSSTCRHRGTFVIASLRWRILSRY